MRVVALLLLFCPAIVSAQPDVNNADLHAVVAKAHASGTFDGVVVVARDGKVVFSEAVGLADKKRVLRNTPRTVFRLASETKQVTALLVMQQVVAKKLSLDDRAGKILPGLSSTAGRVTVRQLLQHVSGLPNPSDGPDNVVPPFYLRSGADASSNTKAALGFCSSPAKREPGVSFEYNNCDYIVLGALLETIEGKAYENIVRERVIRPLRLSSWGVFTKSAASAQIAKGYDVDGKEDLPQNVATYGAAGAIYGNALDLARFDQALMSNELLPEAATKMMFTADPKLYGEALGSWSYEAATNGGKVRVIERQGEIGGTRLLNLLLPDLSTSIVIVANTERADLFDTYSKKGLGYELLMAVAKTGARQ